MIEESGSKKAEPRSHALAEAGPGLTGPEYTVYPRMVKIFAFDEDILDALVASLSPERIATYMAAAGGDREKAMRLYTWNTAVSAAFYGPLQGLEVALRNAMHRSLAARYGPDWYDNPACQFDAGTLHRIGNAKDKLRRDGHTVDPPHVVAALPFGFWVALLGRGGKSAVLGTPKRNYEMTLWRPCLHLAFPHTRASRAQVHQPLDYLRTFRNRLAHHEPVFARHLEADYASILTVTGWICPRTRDWIAHHSRIADILRLPKDASGMMF
jgi:hypothetical protein